MCRITYTGACSRVPTYPFPPVGSYTPCALWQSLWSTDDRTRARSLALLLQLLQLGIQLSSVGEEAATLWSGPGSLKKSPFLWTLVCNHDLEAAGIAGVLVSLDGFFFSSTEVKCMLSICSFIQQTLIQCVLSIKHWATYQKELFIYKTFWHAEFCSWATCSSGRFRNLSRAMCIPSRS